MSDTEPVVEGSQKPGDGHPESVPWTEHVGVKEMLRKREEVITETKQAIETSTTEITGLKAEVKSLSEQLEQAKKTVVDPSQIKSLEGERDKAMADLAQVKRDVLLKEHSINPDDVKDMKDDALQTYIKGLEAGKGQAGKTPTKPGGDLGGGAGAQMPTGGRDKIRTGFDALHPSG